MYFGTSTTQSEPGCRFVLISGRAEFGLIEETIHDEWSLTLRIYNECFFKLFKRRMHLYLQPSAVCSSVMVMDIPYFAYGSNMNLEQMARRCPGAQLGSRARLSGWRYFINGNGYAGIEEFPGSEVWGCLWSLNSRHWEALDEYEGVDGGYYEKKILKVERASGNEEIDAWDYLSNDYDYGIPSSEYQAIVIRGANDVNISKNYIPVLEDWAHGAPTS